MLLGNRTEETVNTTDELVADSFTASISIIYMAAIMLVGILGNFLLITVQMRKKDQTTTDILITVLALFELFYSSVITFMNIIQNARILQVNLVTVLFCKLYWYGTVIVAIGSNFFITLIAMDRYIKTCHPFTRWYTLRRAKVISVITAATALIVSTPALVYYTVSPSYLCVTERHLQTVQNTLSIMLSVWSIVNIGFFISAYIRISLVIRKRARNRHMTVKDNSSTMTRNLWTLSTSLNTSCPSQGTKPSVVGTSHSKGEMPAYRQERLTLEQHMSSDDSYRLEANVASVNTCMPKQSCSIQNPNDGRTDRSANRVAATNKMTLITFLITSVYLSSHILLWVVSFSKYAFGLLLTTIAQQVNMLPCIANPLLFYAMSSKFRQEVKQLVWRRNAIQRL